MPTTAVKIDGKAPSVGDAGFVAPSANLIGAVELGNGSSVWYSSMVQGRTGACAIGDMSSVGDRSMVVDSIVGKHVCIGAGCVVTSATIGDESSVGVGCKVLKGSSLGARSILAAGSVLPAGASVPPGEMWAGSPAKKVGTVDDEDVAGIVGVAEVTGELAKLHMDEAWKPLALCEQEHGDYKRQRERTPDMISFMREDPGWTPLPTLGGFLKKINIHSVTYLIK
mmetsp:Transcript_73315/g.162790  ORF Transcript_73315/g.162790 Transcript_73315/m.162790 type:complete len:225 (-) Transcript_73315:748-1422(-)